ncbi:DUF1891 domain-containing protein [Acinetobacter sp. YIM 103518]|uniref:DUF1891 domain-containing protein n=1 Tax=Acinetobacter faecalis TaxID=2665161 RepID=A0A6L6GCW9_9GAMM|nr:DUF1891 domain-containing protein [Acinetobacter faecalis]
MQPRLHFLCKLKRNEQIFKSRII